MDAEKQTETYRLAPRHLLLIAVFGLSMLSIRLGSVRVLTFHETVFAQPAKEMLATGRWILPTIAGEPFLDRTPLTAWAIALSMTLFGSDAEWVVRIPSVLFGVGTALLLGMMAARWFGVRVGVLAALIELTTVQMVTHARLAEADTLLALTVAAAMYCFALGNVDSPRGRVESRWLPVAFYAAVAAAFMVKWLFGPVFIGLGCFAYCFARRDRRVWRFMFHPLGLLVAALLTVPWLIAAYVEFPGIVDDFIKNHFRRFGGAMGEREPWFAYFYLVPFLLMPWIFYALPTFVSRLRQPKLRESFWLFGVCWFVPGMALLSLSAFKAKHYTMPLLPPLVIASAVGLHEYFLRRQWTSGRLLPWAIGASAAVGAGGIGFLAWKRPADVGAMIAILTVFVVGGTASLCFDRARLWKPQLISIFATIWLSVVGVQALVMPSHDSFRPLAELGRRTSGLVPAGAVVHLVNLPEVQIPYYIDRPQRRWDFIEEFSPEAALAANRGDAASSELYLVTSRDYLDELKPMVGSFEILDSANRKAHHTFDRDRLVLLRIDAKEIPHGMAAQPTGKIRR